MKCRQINVSEKEQQLTAHNIDFTAEAQATSVTFMASKRFCSCTSLDESQQTLPLYGQKAKGFFGVTGAPILSSQFQRQNHIIKNKQIINMQIRKLRKIRDLLKSVHKGSVEEGQGNKRRRQKNESLLSIQSIGRLFTVDKCNQTTQKISLLYIYKSTISSSK